MEHFEILLRPIPRSIWPNKPMGGYMNKLGIITVGTGFNLGISPSLFGSFYQEGGVWALVLISAIYGFLLAKLVEWTTWLHPFAACMLRAILCAALIPLLRGGDLPGIYAWFGMAFWPCLLLVWLRRRELVLAPVPAERRPSHHRRRSTRRAALAAPNHRTAEPTTTEAASSALLRSKLDVES